jgi:hypothetical protein
MSRKLSLKQPYSAKILKGLKTVGKKHKLAKIHHDILMDINNTHNQIITQTKALKKKRF